MLATNVLNVNASWSSNGQAGSLSGTISVDTDTGRLNGLSLNRAGGNMANASYAFDAVTSQGSSGSSAYSLTTAARGSYELRMTWGIPTGSLATYTGGSVSSFSFTSPTLGMFISGQTGVITNRNDAPIDVSLSSAVVAENLPAGSPVGTLSASDPDIGNTFTYSLVSGTGSNDNASFAVAGNALKTAASFNHEGKRSYSIRVRATDQDGLSTERSFSITVADVVELPTLGQLAAVTVQKNSGEATVNLTGIAAGDSLVPVRVTAQSSDPSLVPHPAVDYVSRTFATSATISTGTVRTHGVAVGDFNGDGKMDIAANSATNGTLSVVFGDGVGGFSTPATIAIGYEPYFVVADDFNKDGIDDVAASNFESNLITVRLGSSSGTFSASKSFASGNGTVSPASTGVWYLATGDLNGDGNRDLVSSNIRHDFVSVLLGDGSGGFGAATKVGVGGVGVPVPHQTGPYGAVIRDFNGDGKQDVAVAVMGEDVVRILDGSAGAGSLSVVRSIAVGDAPKGVVAGDFNSDGRIDLAVANTGSGTVTILRGDGVGSFIVSSTIPGGAGTTEVAAVDLDRDGNVDLVTSSKQGRVFRLKGGGDGTFGSPEAFVLGPSTQDQIYSIVKDLNGDGFPDITTVGEVWNQIPGDIDVLLSQAVSTGSLKFTPVPGKSGTANVSVTVEDGGPDRNLATTADNNSLVRTLTVTVMDSNSPPTDISLAGSSVAENATSGAMVGTLSTSDANSGDTFTYGLVPGTGSTDNTAFSISGNQLRLTSSLDFESKNSYSIRIRATDQGGLFTEQPFTITVTNVNETPTDITLSSSSIAENAGANAPVGTLSTTDADAGNTFTYSLVAGTGSTDNAAFNISGNQLRANASLNVAAKDSHTVRIRSTDQGGLFTEKAFTITVAPTNVAPTGIDLGKTEWLLWSAGGQIWRSKPDGTSQTAVLTPSTGTSITAFDVDRATGRIFFAEDPSAITNTRIYSAAIDGSDRQTVYQGSGLGRVNYALTVDTSVGYLYLHSHDAVPIASQGPSYDGKIQQLNLAAKSVTTLPTSFWYAHDLQISSGSQLYVTGFSDYTELSSRIYRQQLDGAANQEVPATGLAALNLALAERTNSIYVSTGSQSATTGNVYRIPLAGGTPALVFDGTQAIHDVEYEEPTGLLYWITDTGIYRSTTQGTNPQAVVTGLTGTDNKHLSVVTSTARTVPENAPTGTVVGLLSASDSNPGNSFTYSFATGMGSDDNASFQIINGQLATNAVFDFEAKSSYSVRIRATDQGGLFTEKAFTVTVVNVNEPPSRIALSRTTLKVPESLRPTIPLPIATVSIVDDALGTNTFSLSGDDAAIFVVSDGQLWLRAGTDFDYGIKDRYTVVISARDGALTGSTPVTATFVLEITNDPIYHGREYVEPSAGQTVTDSDTRSGVVQLIKRGSGSVVLTGSNSHTGGTTVEAGEVVLRNVAALGSGRLTVKSGATVTLDVLGGAVPVGGITLEPGSRIDFGYGRITVASGGYSLTSLRQLLLGGYLDGWTAPAITQTRSAAGVPGGSLGYVVNEDGSATVGFASTGDTNLDGEVDIIDLANFLSSNKFDTGVSSSSWTEGDFNYDGVIDILDAASFVQTALIDTGRYLPNAAPAQQAAATGSLSATDAAFLVFATEPAQGGSSPKKLRFATV